MAAVYIAMEAAQSSVAALSAIVWQIIQIICTKSMAVGYIATEVIQ
jgi:hypothetical protein